MRKETRLTPKKKPKEYVYKLIQMGWEVARVFAPTHKQAKKWIMHYAMMYGQDFQAKIVRVK
jgi:hypothetical protein